MILMHNQHHQLSRSVSFLLSVFKTKLFYAKKKQNPDHVCNTIQKMYCQCNVKVPS